jgi:glycyl-tRNA synthetase beta chain
MSTETADLLIEIGCEELPPKSLLKLAYDFARMIKEHLEEESFFVEPEIFATPRRIAVIFKNVPVKRNGSKVTQWGPPENIAFDASGNPTPALVGFAKKCGVPVDSIEKKDGKLCFSSIEEDCYVKDVMGGALLDVLHKLPIAKRMRWGTHKREFVRPIHWIMVLLGKDVITDNVFDLTPDRISYGHRFHHPNPITIQHPNEYVAALRDAKVEPDFDIRRESIRNQVTEAAQKVGGIATIDDDLLNEVTALVEWPIALTGQFDKQFLEIPHEALVSTMTGNQKYVPVFDAQGNMLPYFIFITHIESKDPKQIIAGNEKVIRPRFSDAQFFFEQDKKRSLESRLPGLENMVFHPKLGSLKDKCVRLQGLVREIANVLGVHQQDDLPEKAALLCKADLLTDMVFEFPDLQGVMGYYYALNDGAPEAVATALKEQYLPRFASDALPQTPLGQIVALADRLDTLSGIFAIGQKPTGDKDPFALRRAAFGILRILIKKELPCALTTLFEKALALYPSTVCKDPAAIINELNEFCFDRLRAFYQDDGGISDVDVFLAVRAKQPAAPYDFNLRMEAVHAFKQLPDAETLAAANKRVSNLLSKQTDFTPQPINRALLKELVEIALAKHIETKTKAVMPLLDKQDYKAVLTSLAELRHPVDDFFEQVMVMDDDPAVRNNRLSLLHGLRELFLQVADISLLTINKPAEAA